MDPGAFGGTAWQTFEECRRKDAGRWFDPINDYIGEGEIGEACGRGCPGYEPVEVKACSKHGEYLPMEGCGGCEDEE